MLRTVWHIIKRQVIQRNQGVCRMVQGPMGALIASLRQAGWDPREPNVWFDEKGDAWCVDESSNLRRSTRPLRDALTSSIMKIQWQEAAKHRFGQGLENRPQLHSTKRHLSHLQRHGLHGEAGILKASLVGGMWPPARRYENGLRDSSNCPLCGHISCDEYHIVWQCPIINAISDPRIEETNNMQTTA